MLVLGGEGAAVLDVAASILRRRGHEVEVERSGMTSIAALDAYDLVVLEPDSRDPNALSILGSLRQVSIVPLLVLVPLTARGQGIRALELGADCFMVSPFDRRELVARSEALIRRYRHWA